MATSHSVDDGEWCKCNKSCLIKRLCHMNVYWRCLILFAAVMIYLLLGGWIFSALERPNEMRQNEAELEAEASYNQSLEVVVDFLVDDSNFSREEAMYLVNNISDAAIRASDVTPSENWIYASSVFFAVTVVTTIGYGTIAPVTRSGRDFFIFYAMVGIPLTLTFLAVLAVVLKNLMARLVKKSKVWVQVSVFLVAGLPLFIFFPAIIFSAVDGWSYSESVYYCFVTLTTVGFGDFVPGIPESRFNSIYRICTAAWIFVGLAFLVLVISLMQQVYEKFEKNCHSCVGRVMKDQLNLPYSTSLDNIPEKPEKP